MITIKTKKITILALHLGIGGVEKYISSLCKMLVSDYEVEIISTYKVMDKPIFEFNKNIKIRYLINDKPNKKEFKKSLKLNKTSFFKELFKSLKFLYLRKHLNIKAIKNIDSDYIITTRIFHNKLVSKYAKKGIIKIATEHNYHNNDKKYIKKLTKSIKIFDRFILVSKELKNFYEPLLPNIKCSYIPNVIDNIPNISSKLNNLKLISIGRLESVKGYEDLIDIMKLINKKNNKITLDIYGSGSLKEKLQNKIDKLNLSDIVKLKGIMENYDTIKDYSLYVMTSFSESFGLVLIEAMSSGVPVIAFNSARGATEIIKEEFGVLVSNRDKEEMSNKIIELLSNKKKLKEMGTSAKSNSYNYLLDNVKEKWLKILKNN